MLRGPSCGLFFRNTPSTAGNSMTSSERPSLEPILKKEASPAVLGGREFWKLLREKIKTDDFTLAHASYILIHTNVTLNHANLGSEQLK